MGIVHTKTTDIIELLVIKIDATLAEIGERSIVEASKMIDGLLDIRLLAVTLKDQP